MKRLLSTLLLLTSASTACADGIACPPDAPKQLRLAAKEIRRYAYLRTGTLLNIVPKAEGKQVALKTDPALGEQEYRLKTEGDTLTISGGSPVAVLYGAYDLAGRWGVRFHLHGDTVPDEKIPFALPQLDETTKPLFALRGIQPFHDFQEGPDWWNADDYKAYMAQMVKMRMNFIGLHSYPWFKPWKHVPAEPGVWIGLPEDLDAKGHVKFAYPSSWANTARPGPGTDNAWGHVPGKTGDFGAGASLLFERGDFGADVMTGATPWPKTPEESTALFNRVGDMFSDVFSFARGMGVKTCIGVETPLWIPDELRARIKQSGKNPDDPAVLREVCRGMFTRILRSHPVDWFWMWTPERGLDAAKTEEDLRMLHEVAKEMNAPFGIAACGWGWLAHQFKPYDGKLPKDIAFSCINDQIGFTPVTPEFGKITGRERWCIPWMEDDTAMTIPQLFAGRVQKDAADAKLLGCTGLMGIHWRTRTITPSLDMLAKSGWSLPNIPGALKDIHANDGPVKVKVHAGRGLPADDYYADFCLAEFGPAVAAESAGIFSRMDGVLPRPVCWAPGGKHGRASGPGHVGDADPRPWDVVAKEYAFVDEFAALRPMVRGAGALERFDYWNGQFCYLKAMGELRCVRAVFDAAIVRAEKATPVDKPAATTAALAARRNLAQAWSRMMTNLLETVATPGEMGTVANLELHTRRSGGYIENFDARLEKILGTPIPADSALPTGYVGRARLIVPTVRSILNEGEALALKIIALDSKPVRSVTVSIRPLGNGTWRKIEAKNIARAVWKAQFPSATADFEYFIEAQTAVGKPLRWPATAPEQNQTVVME